MPNYVVKYFNLEYNGEIIATMTAGKHHRHNINGNPIVLSRLCFKDNHNVVGGSSKLFKEFISWAKNCNFDRIISWSDNSITERKYIQDIEFFDGKGIQTGLFLLGCD